LVLLYHVTRGEFRMTANLGSGGNGIRIKDLRCATNSSSVCAQALVQLSTNRQNPTETVGPTRFGSHDRPSFPWQGKPLSRVVVSGLVALSMKTNCPMHSVVTIRNLRMTSPRLKDDTIRNLAVRRDTVKGGILSGPFHVSSSPFSHRGARNETPLLCVGRAFVHTGFFQGLAVNHHGKS